MNILFANYGGFATNSINHISVFANRLSELGHSCIVATPDGIAGARDLDEKRFTPATYGDVLSSAGHFPNGKPADILHAWTPRENVRRFVEQYCYRHRTKVILHLEDNEEAILESYYGASIEELKALESPPSGFSRWEPKLSHPIMHKAFIEVADAVTVVFDSLSAFVPKDIPIHEALPPLDLERFSRKQRNDSLKSELGIGKDAKVIVYNGGLTSSNRKDIAALYNAMRLLRNAGRNVWLVRTGHNSEDFQSDLDFPISSVSKELGFIERTRVIDILKIADLFVQPGRRDAFNEYRLPSKLPEFLATGRPVITANTNIANRLSDKHRDLLLSEGTPQEIATTCGHILDTPDLAAEISAENASFAKENFDSVSNTRALSEFYERIRSNENRRFSPLWATQPDIGIAAHRRLRELSSTGADPHRIETLSRCCELRSRETRETLSKMNDANSKTRADSTRSLFESDLAVARLSGENETLRAQIESLETDCSTLRSENDSLNNAIASLKRKFSWKLTLPLRAIRRNTIDRLQAKAASRTESQPIDRIREPKAPDERPHEPPPANRDYLGYCEMLAPLVESYKSNFINRIQASSWSPLISIILPVYNVEEKWLRKAIESVQNQIYPNWQLCIADDASTQSHVRRVIEEIASLDDRIDVAIRETNGHISEASNSALELASGDFIALLDHDDEIAAHALARVVDAINRNPDARIIYTDEDKIDEEGLRSQPHFKSSWNPDLILGQNFVSHLGVYRREDVERVGRFRKGFEGAQDWDLLLRVSELCLEREIVHIPEALYHWRSIAGSTATDIGEKDYAHAAAGRAIADAHSRRNTAAKIEAVERFYWRTIYEVPNPSPEICIVIPTRDRKDLIEACIDSIENKTTYANYRIAIANNDSSDPETLAYLQSRARNNDQIIDCPGAFNYNAILNRCIDRIESPLICVLNNDITVITPNWLEEFVSHVCRLEVGIVGGKLYYPHDHVQHAGVILGLGGVASEAFKRIHKSDDGYIHRSRLIGNYGAITGACMVFRKSIWSEIGGFNETDVPNAFGDIDFCLRARTAGYLNVFTPFAELYHHESASRGDDLSAEKIDAFENAIAFMKKNWSDWIQSDPYYNPNLTLDREDFTLAREPRAYSTE